MVVIVITAAPTFSPPTPRRLRAGRRCGTVVLPAAAAAVAPSLPLPPLPSVQSRGGVLVSTTGAVATPPRRHCHSGRRGATVPDRPPLWSPWRFTGAGREHDAGGGFRRRDRDRLVDGTGTASSTGRPHRPAWLSRGRAMQPNGSLLTLMKSTARDRIAPVTDLGRESNLQSMAVV